MTDTDRGVSIEFFTKTIKLLVRMHGDRVSGESASEIVEHLKAIERLYLTLPPVPKKRARKAGVE